MLMNVKIHHYVWKMLFAPTFVGHTPALAKRDFWEMAAFPVKVRSCPDNVFNVNVNDDDVTEPKLTPPSPERGGVEGEREGTPPSRTSDLCVQL